MTEPIDSNGAIPATSFLRKLDEQSQSRTVVLNCSVETPSIAKPGCNRAHVKPFASCCSTTATGHANIWGQMIYTFRANIRSRAGAIPVKW